MLEQGKGSIINTASFVATMAAATSQISYTASKGGVLAMSRELGVQFARSGVRVNALSPGPVATPLLMELFAKDQSALPVDWCTFLLVDSVSQKKSRPQLHSWPAMIHLLLLLRTF